MYSPKISEELVPKLSLIAKQHLMHMTTLVNNILHKAIQKDELQKVNYYFTSQKTKKQFSQTGTEV